MIKKQALSQRELETEKILKAALPEYTIRANMRLSDVIETKGNEFNQMKTYHLDFTICDDKANPIAAVELDDSTHDTADGRKRDNNKNRWANKANLKLIRIRKPDDAYQIRELIRDYKPPKNKTNISGFIFMAASVILTVGLLPKVITGIGNKMNEDLIKQMNQNAAQATKTLNTLKAQQIASQALATPTIMPIQIGQSAPGMVFVKGKSLKECAPDNHINETAWRCTKDHYEPRQYGNH